MVLFVLKYDIHPDKVDAFLKWAPGATQRILAAPGIVEYRAYRSAAGASQVMATCEFADMAGWAAWYGNEDIQKGFLELHSLALNVTTELWGPSPVVPAPLRPQK